MTRPDQFVPGGIFMLKSRDCFSSAQQKKGKKLDFRMKSYISTPKNGISKLPVFTLTKSLQVVSRKSSPSGKRFGEPSKPTKSTGKRK